MILTNEEALLVDSLLRLGKDEEFAVETIEKMRAEQND